MPMRSVRRRPAPVRDGTPREAGIGLAALAMILALTSAPASAQESAHDTVALLWSLGDSECAPVAMELVSDHLWVGTGALAGPDAPAGELRIYFKFMVDGSLLPSHYGKDLLRADGVVLAADPPALVAVVDAPGYFVFTLREAELTYAVGGAEGSFEAHITYGDGLEPVPEPVLAATRCRVLNTGSGEDLGFYHHDVAAGVLPVPHLLPDREYELRFAAPGYLDETVRVLLSGSGPQVIMVTLDKLVPTREASWGALKVTYR
jgi:hypothetical protein